jgi:hypothetical protein
MSAKKESVNPDIDKLVKIALSKAKSAEASLDEVLDVIKVAAAWEKVKHGIKDSDMGSFFEDDE